MLINNASNLSISLKNGSAMANNYFSIDFGFDLFFEETKS